MTYLTENINSIMIVVYCILGGMIVAFVASLLSRRIYGRLVDAIIKADADSAESAKTLDELGVKCNAFLRRKLSGTNVFTSLVSSDNDKVTVEKRRFYIAPEHQIKAQGLYGIQKLSPVTIVGAVVLFAIILVFFQYIVPRFFN